MFVSATYDRENLTVHYVDENGLVTLNIGGSFAWRFNNPGNLSKPGKRVISTVIGFGQRTSKSGQFCIFPDKETGHKEMVRLIKERYGDNTLSDMMYAYAPPKENDTEGYIATLCKSAGITRDDVVGKLDDARFEKLIAAMCRKEGWVPGTVQVLGKGVKMDVKDAVKKPVANANVKVTDGKNTVTVKTNEWGELPTIYSGLFTGEIKVYLADMGAKAEKIFSGAVSSLDGMYSLTAPYLVHTVQPDIHKTQEKPKPQIHIVKAGETLAGIASECEVSIEALMQANGIKDKNKIYERQHLDIPASGAAPATAPTHAPAAASGNASAPTPASKPTARAPATAASVSSASHASGQASVHTPAPAPTGHAPAPTAHPPAASGPVASGGRQGLAATAQRTESNHPVVALSTGQLKLSGADWCKQFLQSTNLDDLVEPFRTNAKNFIAAIRAAKVSVVLSTTFRPIERSYLMYYSAAVARGEIAPDKVPAWSGVDIDWVHRDAAGNVDTAASKKAAKAMVSTYGIGTNPVGKPSKSNHNSGFAVDMRVGALNKTKIKNPDGKEVEVSDMADLSDLGELYGVFWYKVNLMKNPGKKKKDPPHWSKDGA